MRLGAYATIQPKRKLQQNISFTKYITCNLTFFCSKNGTYWFAFICCRFSYTAPSVSFQFHPLFFTHSTIFSVLFIIIPYTHSYIHTHIIIIFLCFSEQNSQKQQRKQHEISCLVPKILFLLQYLRVMGIIGFKYEKTIEQNANVVM